MKNPVRDVVSLKTEREKSIVWERTAKQFSINILVISTSRVLSMHFEMTFIIYQPYLQCRFERIFYESNRCATTTSWKNVAGSPGNNGKTHNVHRIYPERIKSHMTTIKKVGHI